MIMCEYRTKIKSQANQGQTINAAIQRKTYGTETAERISQSKGADYQPLLTRETKGNNASTRLRHGVRMANVTGLSWSLPIMDDTM